MSSTLNGAAVLTLDTQRKPQLAGGWEEAMQAYAAARTERDSGSIDRALRVVAAWLVDHPQDGRALVYQGSLLTLRARASLLPWKKLSMLQDGIYRMEHGVALIANDPALAGGPLEIEVRVVRGTTNARIPRIFGRGASARADLQAVIGNPLFGHMKATTRAGALAWMAVLCEREGDPVQARQFLARAREIDAATANAVWGDTQ